MDGVTYSHQARKRKLLAQYEEERMTFTAEVPSEPEVSPEVSDVPEPAPEGEPVSSVQLTAP